MAFSGRERSRPENAKHRGCAIRDTRAILNRVLDPVVRCHLVCFQGERNARAVEVNDGFVKKCDNCIRPPLLAMNSLRF
jgi:hypothetical protein